jgi:hypothetical protein
MKKLNTSTIGFSQKVEIQFGSKLKGSIPASAKISTVGNGDDFIDDVQTLTKMQLRSKYKAEESCHRNMFRRELANGALVHPAFRKFHSFLRVMGPMPQPGMTVDRIDNEDPEYAPNKVRWADKSTQNSNKSDSHIFKCSKTGKTFTTALLANMHGVTLSAIRKRRANGWSDAEIIAGSRSEPVAVAAKSKATADFPAVAVKSISQSNFAAFSAPPMWGYPKLDFPAGIYTAAQRNRICHPTVEDHRFSEEARSYQWHRQFGEGEYIPATKSELIKTIRDDGDGHLVAGLENDGEERHFVRLVTRNPHILFTNLPPEICQILLSHRPDWVEKMELRFKKLAVNEQKKSAPVHTTKDDL